MSNTVVPVSSTSSTSSTLPIIPRRNVIGDIMPIKQIESIQYRILSPEEIEKISYVQIKNSSGVDNDIYKVDSPYDLRLGTISFKHNCKTCKSDMKTECGHYSHIKLAKPVFNPIFMVHIHKILKCLCFKCGLLLIRGDRYEELLSLSKGKRIKRCLALTKGKKCETCANINPEIDIDSVYKLVWREKKEKGEKKNSKKANIIPPEFVLEKFKGLSNLDIELLGFDILYSRPEWLIIQNLLVIPPTNRPIIQNVRGEKSEDNMFKLYSKIIKFNNDLEHELQSFAEPPNAESYAKKDGFGTVFEALQHAITTLMTNKASKNTKLMVKSTPVKSIKEIIKGKGGWIRGNCMGKRVDFSARTVIGPETNTDVDVFGIPLFIAKTLTFPEIVNQYNIEWLRSLVRNGNEIYPGAESVVAIIEGKARKILLTNMESAALKESADRLDLGWTVNRHIVDGDILIFNRQPSLYKYSFMGIKAKVLPAGYSIVRVPTTSNKIFNADFDGDEGQIHGPRSRTTANEISSLMLIRRHFSSLNSSEIIIAPLQDSVLGPNLISRHGHLQMNKQTFMTYQMASGYFPIGRYVKTTYSLIETVESLLPEDFSIKNFGLSIINGVFTGKTSMDNIAPSQNILISDLSNRTIVNTEPMSYSTIVGKNIKEGLIRPIFNKYGSDITNNLLVGIQKLANRFLTDFGITCSVRDVFLPLELRKELRSNIVLANDAIEALLNEFDQGTVISPVTKTIAEYYEILVSERTNPYLSKNMTIVANYMKEKVDNNLNNMIISGSKGSIVNLTNIVDNIGQTSVNGKRMQKSDENRTLPCFPKFCESLESRGFISNCFVSGLNAHETFIHQKGSRVGLIDTAVKVKQTGYITTKLVKSLEDIYIDYNNRICRQSGQVIDEQFGGNGFNPMWLIDNKLSFYSMNDDEFIDMYV